MLLDINMPRVGGVEVLRQIKADENTRAIPVVMLTTTDDPREIDRCYDIGCNAYVKKPIDYGEFIEVIKSLGLFLKVLSTSTQNAEGPIMTRPSPVCSNGD